MRAGLARTLLALVLAVAVTSAASAASAAASRAPTPRQVARAIHNAQTSRALWATINICNSRSNRDVVGVRGQMPSLGFAASLSMTIQLNSWSASARRFVAIRSRYAANRVSLGAHTSGLQQGGAAFPFKRGQSGLWDATVLYTWTRGGTVLGTATRTTTAGHRDADFGSPAHYSAAACRVS